jgi:hypothetical protein
MGERDTPPPAMPDDHASSDPTGKRAWREVMGAERGDAEAHGTTSVAASFSDGQDVGRRARVSAGSVAPCPVAFSERHSRTFTTLKAMDRIRRHRASNAAKSSPPGPDGDGTLRLLLVGADRREGTCPRDTAAVFDGLLADAGRSNDDEDDTDTSTSSSSLFQRAMEGVKRVDVMLVGPNVRLDPGVTRDVFHAVDVNGCDAVTDDATEDSTADSSSIELRVAYRVGLYHDLREEDRTRGREETETNETLDKVHCQNNQNNQKSTAVSDFTPDLALAFNAGVWGYEPREWEPTMREILFTDTCPLLVTGYTLAEAENDEDALGDMFPASDCDCRNKSNQNEEVEWLWESEINPFRSLHERELGFSRGDYLLEGEGDGAHAMGENCAWQCLAAKT